MHSILRFLFLFASVHSSIDFLAVTFFSSLYVIIPSQLTQVRSVNTSHNLYMNLLKVRNTSNHSQSLRFNLEFIVTHLWYKFKLIKTLHHLPNLISINNLYERTMDGFTIMETSDSVWFVANKRVIYKLRCFVAMLGIYSFFLLIYGKYSLRIFYSYHMPHNEGVLIWMKL